jgi:hypothetical protein
VAGIVAHYAAARGTGEQKNDAEWFRVFRPPPGGENWRPAVVLSAPPLPAGAPAEEADHLDLRALAQTAAAGKKWEHVPPALRAELAARTAPAVAITVGWSHTRGGDARAFSLYHREMLSADTALPFDFVIGNGKRSRDGHIETSSAAMPATETLHICLAGQPGESTAAQKAALGELIIALEARWGTLPLAMHCPDRPEAFAAYFRR